MKTPAALTPSASKNYDAWLRAKVEEALADGDGFLPHDAAMAEVNAMLEQKRVQRAARGAVRSTLNRSTFN